ncbi:MAG TPA: HNH endonuclease [Kofleriaceae bacterium]|nr:HNH endonuclease [Kofleriaceae bacterium]
MQDVTPALRAKVLMRDHGRCRVPGCRAASNIEVHHIVPWARGGAHATENLIALCDGHHVALHRGDVRIEGLAASAVITNVAAGIVHVDNRAAHERSGLHASARAEAVLALTTLGFAKAEARDAVDRALDDEPASLEQLVRAALRRCAPS